MEVYTDGEYRIDVWSEAGDRFDQNATGFRLETRFSFGAEPYWRTGAIQRVTGLSSLGRGGHDAHRPPRPSGGSYVSAAQMSVTWPLKRTFVKVKSAAMSTS